MEFPQPHPISAPHPQPQTQGPYDHNPAPLPDGWIKEWDGNYNRWYFVDTLQNPPQPTWEDPRDNAATSPQPNTSYPSSSSTPTAVATKDGEKGMMTDLALAGGAAWAAHHYLGKKNDQKPPQTMSQMAQGYSQPSGPPPPPSYYSPPPQGYPSPNPQYQYAPPPQQYAPPPQQPPQKSNVSPWMYGLGGAAVGAIGMEMVEGLEGHHHHHHHHGGRFEPMGGFGGDPFGGFGGPGGGFGGGPGGFGGFGGLGGFGRDMGGEHHHHHHHDGPF